MKKAKLKKLSKGHKIDLSEWTLDTINELSETLGSVVLRAVTEVFELAIEEGGFAYIAPATGNPLLVRVSIPLGSDLDDPIYKFSITELVEDLMDKELHDPPVKQKKHIAAELHRLGDLVLNSCKGENLE